jgi:hypothetical protein
VDIVDYEYSNSIEMLDLSGNAQLKTLPIKLFREYLPNIKEL